MLGRILILCFLVGRGFRSFGLTKDYIKIMNDNHDSHFVDQDHDLAQQPHHRLEYSDYETRFPIPHELQAMLASQPPETHNQTLHKPNQRFLVMTCHFFNNNTKPEDCGGFSDRLIQMPYFLLLAHQTNRTFLIHYPRPYPLTEFLQPTHQFDWTISPDTAQNLFGPELREYGQRSRATYANMRRMMWHDALMKPPYRDQRVVFVNANLAVQNMYAYLRQTITSMSLAEYWPGLFRRLFRPSPGLQAVLDDTAQRHDLVAGQYVSAHWRYKYPILPPKRVLWLSKDYEELKMSNDPTVQATRNVYAITENIINCAMKVAVQDYERTHHHSNTTTTNAIKPTPSSSSPIHTVYFAADAHQPINFLMHNSSFAQAAKLVQQGRLSATTTTTANQLGATQNTTNNVTLHIPRIVIRSDANREPPHFNTYNQSLQANDVSRYYSIFVDFWILAHARCAVMGPGGFARTAARVAGNAEQCAIRAWPHQGLRVHGETEEGAKEQVRICPVYLNQWEGLHFETPLVVPV